MQADLETVVIKSELTDIGSNLNSISLKLGEARESILTNEVGKDNALKMKKSKGLLSVINSCASLTRQTTERYTEFLNSNQNNDNREQRGIEILGEFLSSITGVPSAQDHRKVIEMLWAVKSRSEGIESLLEMGSKVNDQILNTLHLHNEKFEIYKNQIYKFNQAIGENEEMIDKTIMSLSILSKVLVTLNAINAILSRAEQIVSKGDIERLSRYSISESDLGDLIDRIYMRRKETSPIFDRRDSQYYYNLKLAHTWVDLDTKELTTILQIPIARMNEIQKLIMLESINILQNDLHMAVVNEGRNEYRFLSSSDFTNCIPALTGTICQKREIKISPRLGCIIKQHNCRTWANRVVHDITNTEILISLPDATNATIACDSNIRRTIELPKIALIHLDLNCNLRNDFFEIEKLSFRHVDDVTINQGEGIQFDISDEVKVLTEGQVSHIIKSMQEATMSLDYLNKTNQILMQAIDEHQDEAEDKWDEISGGMSAWEQSAIWVAICAEAIFVAAVTVCICKMYCSILKHKNGPSGLVAVEGSYNGLRDRVLDLEANSLKHII